MLEGLPQRQAALLLHALSEADRVWILAALSEQERLELTGLVQELHELNVPADPSRLAQWLPPTRTDEYSLSQVQSEESPGVAGAGEGASHSRAELMTLEPHEVSELARLLSAEPLPITLRLLRIQPWPWREKLLAQMSATDQMRLRQRLRDLAGDSETGGKSAGHHPLCERAAIGIDLALIDALARRISRAVPTNAAGRGEVKDRDALPSRGRGTWWHRVRFLLQRATS